MEGWQRAWTPADEAGETGYNTSMDDVQKERGEETNKQEDATTFLWRRGQVGHLKRNLHNAPLFWYVAASQNVPRKNRTLFGKQLSIFRARYRHHCSYHVAEKGLCHLLSRSCHLLTSSCCPEAVTC